MGKQVFALVDGNSFYASCQIAFSPSLKNRPVVVLSNNDGCVVAANQLAKDLNEELIATKGLLGEGGFRSAQPTNMMFQPYFKVKWLLDKHQAAVFSSNYELYADMSTRMHHIIGSFGVAQEIYSIDESFIDLSQCEAVFNLTEQGCKIKSAIAQQIGIPVAVGIASTKTLAKLANNIAKKQVNLNGVLDLTALDEASLNAVLSKQSIGSVWGIGRKLQSRMVEDGLRTARDLKLADPKVIRRRYGLMIERTLRELNGEACLSLEQVQDNKKQIISSRSFGHLVTEYEQMVQAVVSYVLIAAQKLRQQNSHCRLISVYIQTSPFHLQGKSVQAAKSIALIYDSDNSILLAKLAKRALKSIWQQGAYYKKAGVILGEISPAGPLQADIFSPNPVYSGSDKQNKLMAVMDRLNRVNGSGSLFLGSAGIDKHNDWKMNRRLMSSRFTTRSRWDELCVVS